MGLWYLRTLGLCFPSLLSTGPEPAPPCVVQPGIGGPTVECWLSHLSHLWLVLEPPPAPAAELSVCMTSLQLAVTPSMVPLSRLLVFYVRENGEGVADSLQFPVETFFENQVEHRDPNGVVGWGRCRRRPGLGTPGCQSGVGRAQLPHGGVTGRTCKGCPTFGNNQNVSCILAGASPEVTQMGIAFSTHRESCSLTPLGSGLRDTAYAPTAGSACPLPAPFKTGCHVPSASACPPGPPSPPVHRRSQLHQLSSCHAAFPLCPHLDGLARTDASRQRERVSGRLGGLGQAPDCSAVFGSRFH